VLRQLFTFAAQHLGREFSSYCSRAWARVSCCLQRSIAQVIVNRIDGRPDVPEPPSESFVVSEAAGLPLAEGALASVGVERKGSVEIGPLSEQPLGKPSIGSGPSESVGARAVFGERGTPPQIPVFPLEREPRDEKMVGGARSATGNNNNKLLVGGEGDGIVRGRREGREEGVGENLTNIDLIDVRGHSQVPSSLEHSNSRICKNAITSSVPEGEDLQTRRDWRAIEIASVRCNKVTHISPLSCNRLDSSCPPHNNHTCIPSPPRRHINEHTAEVVDIASDYDGEECRASVPKRGGIVIRR